MRNNGRTGRRNPGTVLNDLFKRFRDAGLIAKRDFMCCQNCAGTAIADKIFYDFLPVKKDERKRKLSIRKIRGSVFCTRQDSTWFDKSGILWLSFGKIHVESMGYVGLPTQDVGEVIVSVLRSTNVPYEWDGDPMTRIQVRLDLLDMPTSIVLVKN